MSAVRVPVHQDGFLAEKVVECPTVVVEVRQAEVVDRVAGNRPGDRFRCDNQAVWRRNVLQQPDGTNVADNIEDLGKHQVGGHPLGGRQSCSDLSNRSSAVEPLPDERRSGVENRGRPPAIDQHELVTHGHRLQPANGQWHAMAVRVTDRRMHVAASPSP